MKKLNYKDFFEMQYQRLMRKLSLSLDNYLFKADEKEYQKLTKKPNYPFGNDIFEFGHLRAKSRLRRLRSETRLRA